MYETIYKINSNILNWSDVIEACMEMFRFPTMDEWISPFRRLLTIEQFRNP